MLVLDDKVLRRAGVDYATAVGLLEPAEGEIVVHVRRILDPISIPVIAPAPVAPVCGSQDSSRDAQGGEPAAPAAPTIPPTTAVKRPRAKRLHAGKGK